MKVHKYTVNCAQRRTLLTVGRETVLNFFTPLLSLTTHLVYDRPLFHNIQFFFSSLHFILNSLYKQFSENYINN